MTIWHSFIVTAFFAPLIPAIQEPRAMHATAGAFLTSLLVGLGIALVWSFVLWWSTTNIFRASSSRKDSSRLLIAATVGIFCLFWAVGGEILGDHVTKAILQAL